MMAWIEIAPGIYAKEADPDPEEIVNVNELKKQYHELEKELEEIIVEIPKGADEKVRKAIEVYNEMASAPIAAEMERIAERYKEITGEEIWL